MKLNFTLATVLVTLTGFAHALAGAENNPKVMRSQVKYHPVLPFQTPPGVWASGTVLAKPNAGSPQVGMWFKSDELHLTVGSFADDPKYFSGNPYNMSTADPHILGQVEKLDPDKHYLFKYYIPYPFPFRFTMTDTRYLVSSVSEAPQTALKFFETKLPLVFDVIGGREGHQNGPLNAYGRIVDVRRWVTLYLGRAKCSFSLDLGGTHHTDRGNQPNQMMMNVYSEEACKYVEDIMPFGLEMRVNYTESFFTIDHFLYTAHSLMVAHVPGVDPVAQDVLSDPDFQSSMLKMIDDFWKKAHAADKSH